MLFHNAYNHNIVTNVERNDKQARLIYLTPCFHPKKIIHTVQNSSKYFKVRVHYNFPEILNPFLLIFKTSTFFVGPSYKFFK